MNDNRCSWSPQDQPARRPVSRRPTIGRSGTTRLLRSLPAVLGILLVGCALSSEDQDRLNNYKYNSKLWYEKGDFLRTEDQCFKGLQIDDEDPSLNLLLGYAMLRQYTVPKVTQAVEHFQRVVDDELYPENQGQFKAFLGLGSAQCWLAISLAASDPERSGQFAVAALESLEAAAHLNPESIEALLKLAELHSVRGESRRALADFGKALSQLESQAQIWSRQLALGGIPADRLDAVEKSLAANEARRVEIHGLRANIDYKLDDPESGLTELEAIESIAPLPPHEIYNRARLLEKAGHLEEAVRAYERYLKETDRPIDSFVRQVIRQKAELEARLDEPTGAEGRR